MNEMKNTRTIFVFNIILTLIKLTVTNDDTIVMLLKNITWNVTDI